MMKSTILAAALTLSFAGTAAIAQMPAPSDPAQQNTIQQNTAQQRMPDPHRAAMRIGRQLNLSPDQTAKLEPILADRRQRVLALRSDTSLTDAQRKKQLHIVQAGTRMQMANILSPDQMKQLKTMRKNRMQDGPTV
jgi:protein CpxP